ncbi:MAG: hypothetical protein JNM23_04715 [Bradyrhizobiaceae bacterium]|nr:hypothetical protein [Bradyrhizobiaceae bacterium]
MTKGPNSLQAVLERQARELSEAPTAPSSAPMARKRAEKQEPKAEKFYRASREGKRLIAGHFRPELAKQLKLLAAEEETTIQALLEEALGLLLVKKGRKGIKP